MRSEGERMLDILEAIERIEKYAEEGKQIFESDELIQTWIVHHITIIGEACRTCLKNFRRGMQMFRGQTLLGCAISLSIIILGLIQRRFGQWLKKIFLN
jgi:ribonuclease HepT-like protein